MFALATGVVFSLLFRSVVVDLTGFVDRVLIGCEVLCPSPAARRSERFDLAASGLVLLCFGYNLFYYGHFVKDYFSYHGHLSKIVLDTMDI